MFFLPRGWKKAHLIRGGERRERTHSRFLCGRARRWRAGSHDAHATRRCLPPPNLRSHIHTELASPGRSLSLCTREKKRACSSRIGGEHRRTVPGAPFLSLSTQTPWTPTPRARPWGPAPLVWCTRPRTRRYKKMRERREKREEESVHAARPRPRPLSSLPTHPISFPLFPPNRPDRQGRRRQEDPAGQRQGGARGKKGGKERWRRRACGVPIPIIKSSTLTTPSLLLSLALSCSLSLSGRLRHRPAGGQDPARAGPPARGDPGGRRPAQAGRDLPGEKG